ncbi:alpha/beta hydrolase family protein [Salsuginibacillus kocurii]|uniref:alpha/beta hydrolase family protein n=1 Tax=Salsuginibacillus kocurii TaxID=427078 RepID=UPI000368ABB4|nr:alpha/beta hydrolase [Salsuginibacillus kocurii]
MQEEFVLERSADQIIRGTVFTAEGTSGKKPLVIISHGFKGFKNWAFFPYAAKKISQAGFHVITFNYSKNGVGPDLESFDELDKFAENTFADELEDLEYLLSAVVNEKVPYCEFMDIDNVFLIGHSRGAGDIMLYGTETSLVDIKGMVSWNGISSIDFISADIKKEIREKGVGYIPNSRIGIDMPLHQPLLNEIEEHGSRFNILEKIKTTTIPLLIVQGTEDGEWLLQSARSLYEHASIGELKWIEDANHTFNSSHPFVEASVELNKALEVTIAFLHASKRN